MKYSQLTRVLSLLVKVFQFRDFYQSFTKANTETDWKNLKLPGSLTRLVKSALGDNHSDVPSVRRRMSRGKILSSVGARFPLLFVILAFSSPLPAHPSTQLNTMGAVVETLDGLAQELAEIQKNPDGEQIRDMGIYHETPGWVERLVEFSFLKPGAFLKYGPKPISAKDRGLSLFMARCFERINPGNCTDNCTTTSLHGLTLVVTGECAEAKIGRFCDFEIWSNGLNNQKKLTPKERARPGRWADSCRWKKEERKKCKVAMLFPSLQFEGDESVSPGSQHTPGDLKFINCKLSCLIKTALCGVHDDGKTPLLPKCSLKRGAALLIILIGLPGHIDDTHSVVLLTQGDQIALVDFQGKLVSLFGWYNPILPPFEQFRVFSGCPAMSVWKDCFFLPISPPNRGFASAIFDSVFAEIS
jgi:hypothetical protein